MTPTNPIHSFEFTPNVQLRSIVRNGEPYFVASDVCAALGLLDTSVAVRGLDADEKGQCIAPTPGGPQMVNVVSESGLYSLVFRSRKVEAQAFRKWVTSVVLPSIRKHGGYIAGQELTIPADATPAQLNQWSAALAEKALAIAQAVAAQRRLEHLNDRQCRANAFAFLGAGRKRSRRTKPRAIR